MAVRSSAPVLNFFVPKHEQLCTQGKKRLQKLGNSVFGSQEKLLLTNFLISISKSGARVALLLVLVCVNAAEAVVTH